jgi:hypothetical protein
MAQCTNRKELLRCSNIALNEIQTYPFNEKGLLIMKHKKVSQLLAASLSFLMIAMLCVSSVAMEPSMRIGSVTVHSSLFAKMASESPEKDLITQSNIVKATDEMIQFEEKTVLDVQHLDDGSSLTSYRKDVATILPSEFPTSISPCADGSINQDSWDSSNTVRAYTTIYYDIVKDSGDRSYYKLTKVTGKYYCNNSATKITSQTLRIGQTGWTSNGYREQTKDFDIPASQKDWTKYPDSSWAGVLVDATNRVGCYYVVNIAAKTGKTWYVEISNNIR